MVANWSKQSFSLIQQQLMIFYHNTLADEFLWFLSNVTNSHFGKHVMGMLDCAPLIIVSDVCLTIEAPVAQWLRHWSRKPDILGSISGRVHFSYSLHYLPTAKQLKSTL